MTQNELQSLKAAHDHFATAIQVLTTRVQYFHEEFQGISNVVHFLSVLRDDAKKKVEEIEPPVEKPKETYDMDLTHIKPAVEAEVN